MMKLKAIFFLSLYMLATTEAHQLLKFPVLIQHFSEHRQQHSTIGFIGFLSMHYFNGDLRDADYERDMQLPFKTDGPCMTNFFTVDVPAEICLETPRPIGKETVFAGYNTSFHFHHYQPNIWQPPRRRCYWS